jgi:hypothetical protein
MLKAIIRGDSDISFPVGVVKGLEEEVPEIEMLEICWVHAFLRKHEFQLMARSKLEFRSRLGAYTYPIDTRRRQQCSVRFDGDLKTSIMEAENEFLIHLEQGLTSGQDHKGIRRWCSGHGAKDGPGQRAGRFVITPACTICAYKIGVANLAHCPLTILLPARPKIAAGESAECSSAAGISPFALQAIENLFYSVSHKSNPETEGTRANLLRKPI